MPHARVKTLEASFPTLVLEGRACLRRRRTQASGGSNSMVPAPGWAERVACLGAAAGSGAADAGTDSAVAGSGAAASGASDAAVAAAADSGAGSGNASGMGLAGAGLLISFSSWCCDVIVKHFCVRQIEDTGRHTWVLFGTPPTMNQAATDTRMIRSRANKNEAACTSDSG